MKHTIKKLQPEEQFKIFDLLTRLRLQLDILIKSIDKGLLALCIILLTALLLRMWGVSYGLPYIYHPDEPKNITISQNIFKTGDLNPHAFLYGSLFFYVNSFAYIPYYISGRLLGVFRSRSEILPPIELIMGTTKSPLPSTVLLGRVINIIFSVGAVGLTFFIGKQLTGKLIVGLLASLLMAISPTNIINSRFITPDTFVVFFIAASFLATILVYQQGKTWHYIVAGIFIGFTISCKYNGGLIVLPLIVAHFLNNGKISLNKLDNLYLGLQMCGLGFLATTPFAIIDFFNFFADFRFQAIHYSTGHLGMDGDSLKWYLNYMRSTAGIIYFFAMAEFFRGVYLRSKEIILLSIFPIIYFGFISNIIVRNDRTFLPLTPFLFVLAASFLVNLISQASAFKTKELKKEFIFIIVGLLIICIIQPTTETIKNICKYSNLDEHEAARVWITNNLPKGTKIAIESYSPFIEPTEFTVVGIAQMIQYKPEWYIGEKFDYLIFYKGIYSRYYLEPKRCSNEVSQYNDLFKKFSLIKVLPDGNSELRVYKVK